MGRRGGGASVSSACRLSVVLPAQSRSKAAASISGRTASSPRTMRCASYSLGCSATISFALRRQTRILNAGTYSISADAAQRHVGIGVNAGHGRCRSYAYARIRAIGSQSPIETFEDWIVDRFGRHLYEFFFKGYTEKVWGIPCARSAPNGRLSGSRD